MVLNGINSAPDWSLDRIGEYYPDGGDYTYPDPSNPVRLYLIDTAVADRDSWELANPNLTFEDTILVRGSGDPQTSIPRAHGTQMLSLISGVETGVAPGTPIHVLNYDIYPNPDTTTRTLLTQAIIKAVEHSKHPDTVKMRSAICIATSTIDPIGPSSAVAFAINSAIAAGIPVIVSAGNLGEEAANYIPSGYGTLDGVICVGATNAADVILDDSNHGSAVDLLAPGGNVRTRAESATSSYVGMSGTSPAAALVAGCVLTELSINGSLTPAQVESALKSSAKENPAGGPGLLRVTHASVVTINNPDGPVILASAPQALSASAESAALRSSAPESGESAAAAAVAVDEDSDGIPDVVEVFHHGDCVGSPAASTISLASPGEVQFKFPVAFDLFNVSDPFVLANGCTWGIQCSSNFKTWQVPVGSLTKTTDSQGQVWLTATFPAVEPSCFARIEIHPASNP